MTRKREETAQIVKYRRGGRVMRVEERLIYARNGCWNNRPPLECRRDIDMDASKLYQQLMGNYLKLLFDITIGRQTTYINQPHSKTSPKLKLVLGIDFGATAIGWVRGIMQYNFRRINEDIFGKAYESYLAELRKEQGIFYTPSYITEYIVENTVGKIFDDILSEIERQLTTESFKEAKKLVEKFTLVKVMDPACGSGSFLIKALRLIWRKYARLREILGGRERVYLKNGISFDELGELKEIKRILGAGNNKDRELISKVISRHIHGNDLDRRALEVAKVNIWLEAIKLAPKDFRFDLLGETNHILPDLEMNLACGDSLVGLPEDMTIEVLEEHKEEIVKLWELREKYLEDTSRVELVNSIERVKNELRGVLYKEFKNYLEENNLPLEILDETKPLHWALEFWYVFFGESGEVLPEVGRGFDAVVGNPPYFNIQTLVQKSEKVLIFIKKSEKWRNFYSGEADIHYFFTKLGIDVLRKIGVLGYIVSRYWLENKYANKLRNFLIRNTSILEIDDFRHIYVFEGVGTHTLIQIFSKQKPVEDGKFYFRIATKEKMGEELLTKKKEHYFQNKLIFDEPWILGEPQINDILTKIKSNSIVLKEIAYISKGMDTGLNKAFIVNKSIINNYNLEKDLIKELVKNSDIDKYFIKKSDRYLYN